MWSVTVGSLSDLQTFIWLVNITQKNIHAPIGVINWVNRLFSQKKKRVNRDDFRWVALSKIGVLDDEVSVFLAFNFVGLVKVYE